MNCVLLYEAICIQPYLICLLFDTGHLSPTESDGDMLGYDLYSSALADILSEPTMQPPICVGLYAQWGSGKSFLLKKLEGNVPARRSGFSSTSTAPTRTCYVKIND